MQLKSKNNTNKLQIKDIKSPPHLNSTLSTMFVNKRGGGNSQGPTEEVVVENATSTIASCCSSHPTLLPDGLARCLAFTVQSLSHLFRSVSIPIGQLTKMRNPPPAGWVPDVVEQTTQAVLEDILLPFLLPGHLPSAHLH